MVPTSAFRCPTASSTTSMPINYLKRPTSVYAPWRNARACPYLTPSGRAAGCSVWNNSNRNIIYCLIRCNHLIYGSYSHPQLVSRLVPITAACRNDLMSSVNVTKMKRRKVLGVTNVNEYICGRNTQPMFPNEHVTRASGLSQPAINTRHPTLFRNC